MMRSDPILAVFDSPERARRAVRRLSQVVADAARVEAVPLAPGRYKLADISRAQEVYAAVRGAAVGAPLGGLVGLALASTLVGFLEPSAYPAATIGPRSGSPPM
jgi:hypothetical protein